MQTDERNRLRASVAIKVRHDLSKCSPEFPLLVQIQNGSEDALEKVFFGVEGTRSGYSDPVYESGYQGYSTDKIIASGGAWSGCWMVPQKAYGVADQNIALFPPEALNWVAMNTRPVFLNK